MGGRNSVASATLGSVLARSWSRELKVGTDPAHRTVAGGGGFVIMLLVLSRSCYLPAHPNKEQEWEEWIMSVASSQGDSRGPGHLDLGFHPVIDTCGPAQGGQRRRKAHRGHELCHQPQSVCQRTCCVCSEVYWELLLAQYLSHHVNQSSWLEKQVLLHA